MCSAPISVRPAHTSDIPLLVEFNAGIAQETEGVELDRETLTAGIESLVRHPDRGFYSVAVTGSGEVAGCMLITFEWSDWRNGMFWWIQSVYVAAPFRRQGVFRALFDAVKSRAEMDGGVCGFRLYVEKENTVAQRTYRNLGLEETYYRMFEQVFK